jgi:hypothetical protein
MYYIYYYYNNYSIILGTVHNFLLLFCACSLRRVLSDRRLVLCLVAVIVAENKSLSSKAFVRGLGL